MAGGPKVTRPLVGSLIVDAEDTAEELEPSPRVLPQENIRLRDIR